MSDDRFDRAIDRTVREMLDVEPPAGLRARVMRRIDPEQVASGHQAASGFSRKHPFSRKILWLGAPLAAAAIIVLALLLPRRVEQVQPQATVVTNTPAPLPALRPRPTPSPNLSTANASSSSGLPPAARTVVSAPPRPATEDRMVVAAASLEPSDLTRRIQPLEAIAPIEVAALADKRVEPAAITIDPLNPIAEVQIAPLFSSTRRN